MELSEEKMSTMSGAAIIADLLQDCPPTKIVNTAFLRHGPRAKFISLATASASIYKLKAANVLRKLGHGNYTIDKDKCSEYYKDKKFNNAYTPTPKHKMPKREVPAITDINVINNLLDALVQAEPILMKYKRIIEAIDS